MAGHGIRTKPEHIQRNRDNAREYARTTRNRDERRVKDRETSYRKNLARPFVAWDGEGEDYGPWVVNSEGEIWRNHRYILFGSSHGDEISGVGSDGRGLSTISCLNLLLRREQETDDAFHVWFSAEYDVNMILRDLSWRQLNLLKHHGVCNYEGYKIRHTPRKRFQVSKGGVCATVYDVFGFFHCGYTTALEKFGIGTEAERARIQEGKDRRGEFTYEDIDYIVDYWRAEIGLMPALMDLVRDMCYDAGLQITAWHGPGALASFIIRQEGILEWKSDENLVPQAVKLARAHAFAGGWFYSWMCGLWPSKAYSHDINSAYLYAATLMPRLDNGKWRSMKSNEVTAEHCPLFGLYHIQFEGDKRTGRRSQNVYPLFYRDEDGQLTWPQVVEGWYWGPEAKVALETGCATVLEAWVFENDGTRPFTVVNDYYERRLHLKNAHNPAEKTIKWALAAMYGQYARRVGWDKKRRTAPRSHQLEWAGFITSYCRAMVYRAASYAAEQGALVSVDTDGVTSTIPIPDEYLENGPGDDLGQWKRDEVDGLFHWQNGVYWTRTADEGWECAKARGVPRGRIEAATAFEAYGKLIRDWTPGVRMTPALYGRIEVIKTRFVGYREVLAKHNWDQWRTWTRDATGITLGGGGKLVHMPGACEKCRDSSAPVMHTVVLPPFRPGMTLGQMRDLAKRSRHFPMSQPHKLPWTIPVMSDEELLIEEVDFDIIAVEDERDDL
jgi:hypothetical protein